MFFSVDYSAYLASIRPPQEFFRSFFWEFWFFLRNCRFFLWEFRFSSWNFQWPPPDGHVNTARWSLEMCRQRTEKSHNEMGFLSCRMDSKRMHKKHRSGMETTAAVFMKPRYLLCCNSLTNLRILSYVTFEALIRVCWINFRPQTEGSRCAPS